MHFASVIAVLAWLFVTNCSTSNGSAPPVPKNSGVNGLSSTPAPIGGTGDSNPLSTNKLNCPSDSPSSSPNPVLSGSSSSNTNLFLVDAVTYESKIKAIIASNCLSCHNNQPDKPNLADWNGVQSVSNKIISTSGNDKVVSSGHNGRINLASQDKADFQSWAQAGYQQGSALTGSVSPSPQPSGTGTLGSSVSSACPSGNSSSSSSSSESLSNPKKLAECNGQGLVYDYEANKDVASGSQVCTTFKLGTWCDTEGIKREFGTSGNAAQTKISELTGQGYRINQCGEDGAARFVYLIKEEEIDGQNQLKIYKLRPK